MKNFTSLGLLATVFILATALRAEPALAGNAGLQGQTLDPEGIKAVLLGKRITVGEARVIIVISKTSAAQDAFLQAHVGMTTSQFQNHWRRLFMTGGGSAPKVVETEVDACKLVSETPGAITVADSAAASALVVLGK